MSSTSGLKRLPSCSSTLATCLNKATDIKMSQILSARDAAEYATRRTKIVCTMGPACWDVPTLVKLIDAGMNVCRLNFSHGDHISHANTLTNVREALKQCPGKHVAFLLDTKGPEIRTGLLKESKIHLKCGQKLKVVTDYTIRGDETTISCSYPNLPKAVKKGGTILMADGSVVLRVEECGNDHVICTVLNNASIGEKKNMNLPGVKVDLPVIGEKDIKDIVEFGIPQGCHFIAASFVQSPDDVKFIRQTLGKRGRHIKIIPKIENAEGIANFDEILAEADGIMVARGDMGMEIPSEKVFLAQKMMIAKCNVAGKPVITATQMLESMHSNPRPTRAEVADVANAVLDGTDCVMLSGETANGNFPVEAVSIMGHICLEAESCIDYNALRNAMTASVPRPVSIAEAVCRAAVETAADVGSNVIVALTETGETARFTAKYRPPQQVLALSTSDAVCKQLQLHRGVVPVLVPSLQGTDSVLRSAISEAKAKELVSVGESVVAVHGTTEETSGGTNMIKVVPVQ